METTRGGGKTKRYQMVEGGSWAVMCDSCDVLRRDAFAPDAKCRCNFCPSPSVAGECQRCGHSLGLVT